MLSLQPRHSQLQHGIFLGTRGLLDDAIGESLQAMKPSMIVISEIQVSILYESMLDVHEMFHVFFCKVLQWSSKSNKHTFSWSRNAGTAGATYQVGHSKLAAPSTKIYTMLSKVSLCSMFKYLQTVRNSTDRKGRHRNAGSLIIYKNYRDKTKQSESSNKNGRILR